MKRTEVRQMTDDDRSDLQRRLRDKYIDKFGYTKKIVIDDCLDQFMKCYDSQPSVVDLKELDVVIKKRVMGKDVPFVKPTQAFKSKALTQSQKAVATSASQPNIKQNAGGKKEANTIIGKGKNKAVELAVPAVTGKITNLPAPKIKKKKAKELENASQIESSRKSQVDEELLESILRGEGSNANQVNHKGHNKWGILEMYSHQQFENDKKRQMEVKKTEMEAYRKVLDEQMSQHNKMKKMEDIETTAGQLKSKGENHPTRPIDEQTLFSEYDSLQKEMERSHIMNPRELQIHRLQNMLSWSGKKDSTGGLGADGTSSKQSKIQQYKDILDKQMQEKQSDHKDLDEKEYFKKLYSQQNDERLRLQKDQQAKKLESHKVYADSLKHQIDQKRKMDLKDMNEREFRYNKDLLTKASKALLHK